MTSLFRRLIVLAMCLLATQQLAADDALRKRLQDKHATGVAYWIYNDIAAGFKTAKSTGKPLFVTFRCVPCEACEGFDGEVASGNAAIKRFASENFVCVRQVEMKNVDLTQFQFDHDLNWAAMFLNADGTVYARYGTQSEKGADAYNSVEGLLTTMKRVVELHQNYPANKTELIGKTAKKKPWKFAKDMPTLTPKLRKGGQTSRSNCIHCHNIHDAENEYWREQGTMSHDRLWRYPLPENIGLTISAKDGKTITAVEPQSPSHQAGLRKDQQIDLINGQSIASVADVQWTLHHQPNSDKAKVAIRLSDGSNHLVTLEKGWKKTDISWRGSLWSLSPRLRVWLPPLSKKRRLAAGIKDDQPALLVKWINRGEAGGKAVIKAGLREGDILLTIDGKAVPKSPSRLNEVVKLNHKVGDSLPITVLRDGKKVKLEWPLVE